jgi:hypothetical protein
MFGPYWEHVLGYWRAHVEKPDSVMFLRYEEVMAAPAEAVRKMAEFLGRPFGAAEKEVERVVQACGIETLRGQERGQQDWEDGAGAWSHGQRDVLQKRGCRRLERLADAGAGSPVACCCLVPFYDCYNCWALHLLPWFFNTYMELLFIFPILSCL